MNGIFWITANFLNNIAKMTGMTYNEINILVYYLLIPLTWTIMMDVVIGLPIFTSLLLLVWVYIFAKTGTKGVFSKWCDKAFKDSVDFLLWFKKIGWNYIVSSVVICVILPLIIYGLLIWCLIAK